MGTNLPAQAFLHRLSENIAAITFCKWGDFYFIFFNSGRALVNRAGRKPVRAGCSALRNMPSWNTGNDCDEPSPEACSNFAVSSVVRTGSGSSRRNCLRRLATMLGSCSCRQTRPPRLYASFSACTFDFTPEMR